MSSRLGRAARGMSFVCLWLVAVLALPAQAQTQVLQEGVAPEGSNGVIALAAGFHHSCALRSGGRVTCWGNNDYGQAGLPTDIQVTAIGAGGFNTCAIRDDGDVMCWGQATELQQVPAGPFVRVAVADNHACGLRPDGQATCWGGSYTSGSTMQPWGTFVALSAEADQTCGLHADGSAECWRADSGWPVPLPGGQYHALSMGWDRACVLDQDGGARCWDLYNYGVERGSMPGPFIAVGAGGGSVCALRADGRPQCNGYEVGDAPLPEGTFTAIALGASHACAIRSDGTVACWGGNYYGESTPPPMTSMLVPGEGVAPGGQGTVRALASGEAHTCALRQDGTVSCWGNNDYGQASAPPSEIRFAAIGAGGFSTCGVRDDGGVVCWGQLGYVPAGQFIAVAVGEWLACGLHPDGQATCWSGSGNTWSPPGYFAGLTADGDYACGLRFDGSVECWREYQGGQVSMPGGPYKALSAGPRQWCGVQESGEARCWDPYFSPNERPGMSGTFTAVSTSLHGACALRTDGQVDCWGNVWSQPGTFTALSAGREHVCGIRPDGTVACWGQNEFGQATPPKALTLPPSIAAGGRHTCMVLPDGQADCWGDNGIGQASPPADPFVSVGSGDEYSCGLREDGSVACWGDNSHGQHTVPLEPLSQLSVGRMHACGVTEDGRAKCWGWNSNGQADAPAGYYDTFENVSAGFVHSCGVLRDYGNGMCWGYNGDGQTFVPSLPWGQRWLTIQAGDRHSCGLASDGTIQCWGSDTDGQIWSTPTGYFRALAAGAFHSCAIRTDGRLACWGANWAGQTDAPAGTFVAVSAGSNHSCAIRSDGLRQCWGDNALGQAPQRWLFPPEFSTLGANAPFEQQIFLVDGRPGEWGGEVVGQFRVGAGNLPPGLELSIDGRLSGVPTIAGAYRLTIEGVDERGFAATQEYDLVVDATPPDIQLTVDGYIGENGWYASNVYFRWYVSDQESRIFSGDYCHTPGILADTAGTVVSCTAESAGGTATQSVTIKRDLTAPDTTLTATPAPATSGTSAVFEFQGADATAGVNRFECSLDGAAFATCTSPYSASVAAGNHSFQVRAVDNAGNRDAAPASYGWFVDNTPPQIVPVVSGVRGNLDWYVSDVQVSWQVSDAESAVTSTGCNAVTLNSDTPGASFTCTATSVGGTTSKTVTVKRDATAPVIVAAATAAPNAAGWYNGDVTVGFSCSDATSGSVGCPGAQVLSVEGTAVMSASRTITDAAGNSATSNAVTVKIDRTAPTLTPSVAATLLLNSTTQAAANGSDALSGVATQQCAPLATSSIGSKSVSCTVTDAAGNSANSSAAYRVVYGFNGFSGPVQNLPTLNVFKAGRSVPFRWRVLDAQGAPVSNLTAAAFAATAISCPSASEYRISTYGGSNGQLQNLGNGYYQLDWSAPSSYRGTCKRLNLDLGDGEAHPAQFKFN